MSTDEPFNQAAWRAYNAAIRLLGRREHSVFELTRKLRQRDHDNHAIQLAIAELQADNYINDQRCSLIFVEQRIARGYGPLWLKARLLERGIDENLIENALLQQSVDWVELARELVLKRYQPAEVSSKESRIESRIARFLASRGFSRRDSLRAVQAARSEIACVSNINWNKI